MPDARRRLEALVLATGFATLVQSPASASWVESSWPELKSTKDQDWSQYQCDRPLGPRAKVSAADICRIETGRMVPYPSHAERLAAVLGLEPEELTVEVDAP